METYLEIYKPGTKVEIVSVSPKLIGTITEVSISSKKLAIEYNVSWWHDTAHYHEWLQSFEIEPVQYKDTTLKIGFYPDEN